MEITESTRRSSRNGVDPDQTEQSDLGLHIDSLKDEANRNSLKHFEF